MSGLQEAGAVRDVIAKLMWAGGPDGLLAGVGLERVGDGYGVAVQIRAQVSGVPISIQLAGAPPVPQDEVQP